MSGETIHIDFSRPVPLFPLRGVVLMPHATVPLHIFEPRYRAMTAQALDTAGLIAMASVTPDQVQSLAGNPPLRSVVCVGYIVRHERLPDGRYNLLLHGLVRARILEEHESDADGFRLATLSPFDTVEEMEIDLEEVRHRLDALLYDPQMRELAAISRVHRWLSDELPTRAVIDLVAMTVMGDDEQRYAMLAEPDTLGRAARLERYLQHTRDIVHAAKQQGSAVDEAGYPLN
jgi:Lon protease-like protein